MLKILDCTFRDGGYYNDWDFPEEILREYLDAMVSSKVDIVELGLRTFERTGFKGPHAYTTDKFLNDLQIPEGIVVSVMVNASELLAHAEGPVVAVSQLFASAKHSKVKVVRLACHFHEVNAILPACNWLNKNGYRVGVNLMQITERSKEEILAVAKACSNSTIDVLYFADSLGGMKLDEVELVVNYLREAWVGEIGIHAHDNMGRALANSLKAIDLGVKWIDCTVTGMGRGPGNVQTEYVAIEVENIEHRGLNITPLLRLIKNYFKPMQEKCGWGMNPYYYMAGQLGIHPTYIQEMLGDKRFEEEDLLALLTYLKGDKGNKFVSKNLQDGRQKYLRKKSWHLAARKSFKE